MPWRTLIIIFLSVLGGVLLSMETGVCGTKVPCPSPFKGALAEAVFGFEKRVSELKSTDAKGDLAKRVEGFIKRFEAYNTAGWVEDHSGGDARWIKSIVRIKQGHMHRAILALGPESESLEREARSYSESAVLYYEWEGMPEGPREEMKHAMEYLKSNQNTKLKGYLLLFIVNRYQWLVDIYTESGDHKQAKEASAKKEDA
ncbi:MAG: hypothetical protein MUP30_08795, partial [Deltaproteobacteria bacterium]|nr:hypothetical protein [Deltaproteobacteria bacterium]